MKGDDAADDDDALGARTSFEVEAILGHRGTGDRSKYYIKWKGFPAEENTWELKTDLEADGLGDDILKYEQLQAGNSGGVSSAKRRRTVKRVVRVRNKPPGQLSPTGKNDAHYRRVAQEEAAAARAAEARAAETLRAEQATRTVPPGTFYLTRSVFLRGLALIYLTAFQVAYNQNPALLGDDGLLPAQAYWNRVNASVVAHEPHHHDNNKMLAAVSAAVSMDPAELARRVDGFVAAPNLLWFMPTGTRVAPTVQSFALVGSAIAAIVLLSGTANAPLLAVLWLLYFSIDGVGQRWYSFGWESQLLETGFLAIFAAPLLSLSRRAPNLGGWTVVWGYRWLIFRIMLGAGLIKIRGDQCWRDLTCMNYHYETQPVPGPLTQLFHAAPTWWHSVETGGNHFVELIVPFFMLLGRPWMIAAGVLQILFQVVLIASGNLSFLNWLTILPSLWCFDDAFLLKFSGYASGQMVRTAIREREAETANSDGGGVGSGGSTCASWGRGLVAGALALLLAYLSVPVVGNLLALDGQQAMNTNFNAFKIVNTYGAFGSITKRRTEIILEGTRADDPAEGRGAVWQPFEFKCKPGRVDRTPCLITPYHYRLDWLMWFAAFGNYQGHPWLLHLTAKLLVGDPAASGLLAENPFLADGAGPPKFIRAEHYEYKLEPPGSKNVWRRKRIGEYFPPLELGNPSFEKFIRAQGWVWPPQRGGGGGGGREGGSAGSTVPKAKTRNEKKKKKKKKKKRQKKKKKAKATN